MDNIVKLPFSLIVDLARLTVAMSSPPRAPNNPTRTGIEFILPREQQTVIERDFRAFAFTNGAAVRVAKQTVAYGWDGRRRCRVSGVSELNSPWAVCHSMKKGEESHEIIA